MRSQVFVFLSSENDSLQRERISWNLINAPLHKAFFNSIEYISVYLWFFNEKYSSSRMFGWTEKQHTHKSRLEALHYDPLWPINCFTQDSNGQDCTVVLLDSEAIDAFGGEGLDDDQIFTITVLLSSVLIFNSRGVPRRRDVERMEYPFILLFLLLRDLRNQNALCNRLLSIKQGYLFWNTGLQKRLHIHGKNVGDLRTLH